SEPLHSPCCGGRNAAMDAVCGGFAMHECQGFRTVLVGLLAAALLALAGTPADAASVNLSGGQIVFSAGQAEENWLVAEQQGNQIEFSDIGAAELRTSDRACTQEDDTTVSCSVTGVSAINADLGTLDDSAEFDTTLPVIVLGGDGDDDIETGDGPDR